jgi:hypothetical protein
VLGSEESCLWGGKGETWICLGGKELRKNLSYIAGWRPVKAVDPEDRAGMEGWAGESKNRRKTKAGTLSSQCSLIFPHCVPQWAGRRQNPNATLLTWLCLWKTKDLRRENSEAETKVNWTLAGHAAAHPAPPLTQCSGRKCTGAAMAVMRQPLQPAGHPAKGMETPLGAPAEFY